MCACVRELKMASRSCDSGGKVVESKGSSKSSSSSGVD